MTIKESIEQMENLVEAWQLNEADLNQTDINAIKCLLKNIQELIEYLKDLLENRYTNSKVVWFDSEYAKIYGELCTMAGANDDRLPLVPLSEIENILSKIEKR